MKLRMEVKKMLKSIKEMLWEEEAMPGMLWECCARCFEAGCGVAPCLDACVRLRQYTRNLLRTRTTICCIGK